MPCGTSSASWPLATGVASSWRSSTTQSDRRLTVARVLGAKGLTGGVRVELLTDHPDRFAPGSHVWIEGSDDPLRIRHVEIGGRVPVLYFDRVTTRDGAQSLANRFLEAPARTLAPGEYYWADLIGLRVENASGAVVGELVEVFRAGGNEVYRIDGPGGERLVPALRSAVASIDLDARRMVIADDDAEEVR